MAQVIKARYALRSGTTAQWAANDEVLGAGEVGEEVTTDGRRLRKTGNGVDTFSALPYRINYAVDESVTPTDKQVLTYDHASGTWKPSTQSGVPPGGTTGQVLTKLSATDGDADWRDSTGGGGAVKIGSATVTGSAITSLVLSGLTLSTTAQYRVIIHAKNASASNMAGSLFFNGDTTLSHYSAARLYSSGTNVVGGGGADATVWALNSGQAGYFSGPLIRDLNGYARLLLEGSRDSGTSIAVYKTTSLWSNVSAITSITLAGSITNSLDVGTTVEVWSG